jgi:hypothetical protein
MGMLQRKTGLKRSGFKRKAKKDKRTYDEKDYFSWLLTQPCIITGRSEIERSHIRRGAYGAGMGKKPSDYFCIPLYWDIHKELHRGDKTWESKYGFQEVYLLKVWQNYGIDRIPIEAQHKFINPEAHNEHGQGSEPSPAFGHTNLLPDA